MLTHSLASTTARSATALQIVHSPSLFAMPRALSLNALPELFLMPCLPVVRCDCHPHPLEQEWPCSQGRPIRPCLPVKTLHARQRPHRKHVIQIAMLPVFANRMLTKPTKFTQYPAPTLFLQPDAKILRRVVSSPSLSHRLRKLARELRIVLA